MTHIALVRRGDVIGGFTDGYRIIMATGTHPHYFIVIHVGRRHWCPRSGSDRMTGITHIRGSNVVGIFS